MNELDVSALVNTIGFAAGLSLYAMLLVMVLGGPASSVRILNSSISVPTFRIPAERLPLFTGLLGLVWNVAEIVVYVARDLQSREPAPFVVAIGFTALGFLPAVVVHSAIETRTSGEASRLGRWVRLSAYGLSATGALLQWIAAATGRPDVSDAGLRLLTVGFLVVIAALFAVSRRAQHPRRAVWFAALSVFAVSALHLTHHTGNESWLVELVGHHASIPLAVAILYQDYRFALADIFLKRALSLVLVVAVAIGLYIGVVSRLLSMRDSSGTLRPLAVGAMIGVWVLMALAYPALRAIASWFVDAVVLHRADYDDVRASIARDIAPIDDTTTILDAACQRLGPALAARSVKWRVASASPDPQDAVRSSVVSSRLVRPADGEGDADAPFVTLSVPTAESPQYVVDIGDLTGGRRLLSDDVAMLEAVANLVARRIDAVRVSHQRFAHDIREQEISKLATEAELRAIRAQLNPHFLFNALTTIGYLIQTSPARAFDTLMRLTGLLRAVLNRGDGEFSTLGEELDLVESYLAIESARLEERLVVHVDVPAGLRDVRIPMLVLQPLVENAIKHGIAPARAGGELSIRASTIEVDGRVGILVVTVADTGLGASEAALAAGRAHGIGLSSIQRRLEAYFGDSAGLEIASTPGQGTIVELRIPLERRESNRRTDSVTVAGGER